MNNIEEELDRIDMESRVLKKILPGMRDKVELRGILVEQLDNYDLWDACRIHSNVLIELLKDSNISSTNIIINAPKFNLGKYFSKDELLQALRDTGNIKSYKGKEVVYLMTPNNERRDIYHKIVSLREYLKNLNYRELKLRAQEAGGSDEEIIEYIERNSLDRLIIIKELTNPALCVAQRRLAFSKLLLPRMVQTDNTLQDYLDYDILTRIGSQVTAQSVQHCTVYPMNHIEKDTENYLAYKSQFTEGKKPQLYGELHPYPQEAIIEYLEKKNEARRLQEDRDREVRESLRLQRERERDARAYAHRNPTWARLPIWLGGNELRQRYAREIRESQQQQDPFAGVSLPGFGGGKAQRGRLKNRKKTKRKKSKRKKHHRRSIRRSNKLKSKS